MVKMNLLYEEEMVGRRGIKVKTSVFEGLGKFSSRREVEIVL